MHCTVLCIVCSYVRRVGYILCTEALTVSRSVGSADKACAQKRLVRYQTAFTGVMRRMSTKEAVQRTRINFVLGLDRITVSGADNIRKLEESGDTDRVIDADRNLQSLPLWARIFFPVTRFYSTVYGWFLPFVVSSHSSYKPCRAFLDQRFSKRAFFTDDVKAAADELEKGAGADTDTLNGTYQRAIFRSFGGSTDLPQELLDETKNQAKGIADAVLPWKRWPAQSCAKAVYSYAAKTRDQLPDAKGLPDEVVTNMGHVSRRSAFNSLRMCANNKRVHVAIMMQVAEHAFSIKRCILITLSHTGHSGVRARALQLAACMLSQSELHTAGNIYVYVPRWHAEPDSHAVEWCNDPARHCR